MYWLDLLFVFGIALLLTAIFVGVLRRPGPWPGWWWFFFIVLLGGWMAATWARPVGPAIWGVAWLPILWMGLLFALLLGAMTPARPPPAEPPPSQSAGAAATAAFALGACFWFMLVGLVIAIAIGYAI
jgi:hypothetical protein